MTEVLWFYKGLNSSVTEAEMVQTGSPASAAHGVCLVISRLENNVLISLPWLCPNSLASMSWSLCLRKDQ